MHALIMAGGRSERMRSRGGPQHKALKHVLHVPLIERNVTRLLAHGIRHMTIAVNDAEVELRAYLDEILIPLMESFGTDVSIITENSGLGNIGAASLVKSEDDVLLIYVDNLCSLDIDAMHAEHRRRGAALTIATRKHQIRNPFGELVLEAGFVTAYREKPIYSSIVSSGTCILSPDARAMIPSRSACNAVDLFAILRENDRPILAFEHETPWIDINDIDALRAAENIVVAHRAQFETLTKSPYTQVLVVIDENRIHAYFHQEDESNIEHFQGLVSTGGFDVAERTGGTFTRYHIVHPEHHRIDRIVSPKGYQWTAQCTLPNDQRLLQRIRDWNARISRA
jgi:NDP-sugar pyrophosphorylase family protein